MLQHVLLGVIAPPLLLLGLPASMAAALARIPGVRAATEPVPAQLAAAAVMVGWHVPALYDLTLASEGIHIFEHLTFTASGVLFWWPVLDATSAQARWRLGELGKLAYLLIGTLPQDGVAIVLQFSRELFYPWYGEPGHRIPGWDPVIDQNVAGTVLQMFGKTSYLVAAVAIFYRWVARDRAEEGELLSGYR
jgi:cytochrome c oxidase assembly factor CtaG